MRLHHIALIALLTTLTGCPENKNGPDGHPGGKFPLTLALDAQPPEITVNMMPGTGDPNAPQPREVKLTLTVTNGTRSDYHGTWKDAAPAKFWVTDNLTVIWEDDTAAAQVLTNIDLKPGESKTYPAVWRLANAKPLVGKRITAHAKFQPEDLTAQKQIPIKTAQ
jgi:hypothetical protein